MSTSPTTSTRHRDVLEPALPQRTRVALIAAVGIAIIGLLVRPLVSTHTVHRPIAPAAVGPTPPLSAPSPSALDAQLLAVAQRRAARMFACPTATMARTGLRADRACGALVVSTAAVLAAATNVATSVGSESPRVGQSFIVEIAGRLEPVTTTAPIATHSSTTVGEPGHVPGVVPVALRITLTCSAGVWVAVVGQP